MGGGGEREIEAEMEGDRERVGERGRRARESDTDIVALCAWNLKSFGPPMDIIFFI